MGAAKYKGCLVGVLAVILAFNYVDRLALGIVLRDIKTELFLSDTQLGFLSGIAFALFFAVMSLPIARWVDRGNRVTLITATTALWSIAVACYGAAANFAQILLIRAGTGVAEAGCIPPAQLLIADEFPREQSPRAISRYMLGVPLGLTVGYLAAGWLNEMYGWRATFVILGLPGLLLAALAHFTLREPQRFATSIPASAGSACIEEPRFVEVLGQLASNRTFRDLLMCFCVWFFCSYGLVQWLPAFFIRSHGMHTGELGMWLALVSGGGGAFGVYLGGELATRYAARNERRQLAGCACAFVLFAVLAVCAYLASNRYLTLAGMLLASIGGNLIQGPVYSTVQTLVPPRTRATSMAVIYLFVNLIGMGLGPLAVGALSDALRAAFGNESLRYALVLVSCGYFWAAWHLWRASRTVAGDIAAVSHVLESSSS